MRSGTACQIGAQYRHQLSGKVEPYFQAISGTFGTQNTEFQQKKRQDLENVLVLMEKAKKANPSDMELQAAHGSAVTMLGIYEKVGLKRVRYVEEGSILMDEAVRKDPENVGVLLQRASNSINLPTMFERSPFAIQDFKKILSMIDGKKDVRFKAKIVYQLGIAYELTNKLNKAKG